ncbi:GntR family transcriptional regulator [Paenibacillus methanolicus]|uniref:DNA-binding transcriptional regulator YhcF (GntR family) n=1 Tax=Paenibacillus methanolicus TaxID=582686 RepID=A0A5S5BTI2_9BACL|nr:GntR family transcriptional regulator [Paenibacillus methanolicus]TYP69512.1 DNA-binding transcriptional regulator YhcF (GntR family) [Paenibacillus methanolicus]
MTNFDEGQPIFQQVADLIEDDILIGTYLEDDQIISVSQFTKTFHINPATVVKGINLLVTEGTLYKKRGLGMYVAKNAKEIIMKKRRDRFLNEQVTKLLDEAYKLQLTEEDIIRIIRENRRGH